MCCRYRRYLRVTMSATQLLNSISAYL